MKSRAQFRCAAIFAHPISSAENLFFRVGVATDVPCAFQAIFADVMTEANHRERQDGNEAKLKVNLLAIEVIDRSAFQLRISEHTVQEERYCRRIIQPVQAPPPMAAQAHSDDGADN